MQLTQITESERDLPYVPRGKAIIYVVCEKMTEEITVPVNQ